MLEVPSSACDPQPGHMQSAKHGRGMHAWWHLPSNGLEADFMQLQNGSLARNRAVSVEHQQNSIKRHTCEYNGHALVSGPVWLHA